MPLSVTEIVLSNIKDTLGILGAVLATVPFFRLEYSKRFAADLNKPPTTNTLLRRSFQIAARMIVKGNEQPSRPDFQATIWGLFLISISFLVSMVLPYLAS